MKRARRKLSLLVAGCLLGCLLAEGALRLLGVSFPLPYFPDEHAGWRLQPGFAAWFGKEGRAYVEVNRAGFRDVDHALEKPSNTVRIAILGDSYAEAAQVPLANTFWSVLGPRLEACSAFGGRRVEVLNFGVSGYGTAQELQVLRHHVWQYKPDLVLLAFFGGNDLRNNSAKLEPERTRPFLRRQDGQWQLDESFRQHPDFLQAQSNWTQLKVALINASRLLQLLNEIKSNRQPRATNGTDAQAELGVDDLCFVAPRTADWEEAWQVTEELLVEMSAETREHNAEFWIATVTSGIQVDPAPERRAEYQRKLGTVDLFYAERRLEQLGLREQFSVVALGPPMLTQAESECRYWHGFTNSKFGEGHWNVDGHRRAGELIADAICRRSVNRP